MHTFRNPMGVSDFLFAGFQVSLPIFFGSKNEPRIAGAQAQLVAAQEAARALRNRVRRRGGRGLRATSWPKRTRSICTTSSSQSRARQCGAQSRATRAGRTDFIMLLDSARELRMHELNEAMHLPAYEQRLAELQRAVGGDLGWHRRRRSVMKSVTSCVALLLALLAACGKSKGTASDALPCG